MKRKYAAVGEKVKIINPLQFIRCGYTLTPNILWNNESQAKLMREVVDKGLIAIGDFNRFTEHKMSDLVGFLFAKNQNFGGSDRKLFEEECSYIKDKLGEVIGKRFVKTGFRSGAYQSYEGEWEGPSLDNEKTHCVYNLRVGDYGHNYWVCAKNCEAIK